MKKILLIDGSNLLFRGYHAIASRKNVNADDIPINAFVTSFLQSLKNYVVKFECDEFYVVWDKKLIHPSTNFRKEAKNIEYKAHRNPEISKKVFASEETITPIIESLGAKVMYPSVMEADDVIAWLSFQLKGENLTIISRDCDFAQLITPNCSFYNPIEDYLVTHDSFEESFPVPRDKYLLYKAIKGDASDNINGLNGYGEKKAAKLALEWPGETTPQQQDDVKNYIRLMDLTVGYRVHPEEEPSYHKQFEKVKTQKKDLNSFSVLIEQHDLTPIKYQIEKWRGIFSRMDSTATINNKPINDYLKGLFG